MAFTISRRKIKEISKENPYISDIRMAREYGALILDHVDSVTRVFTKQKYILFRTNLKGDKYPRDALWEKEGNKTLAWKFIGFFQQ
jgi:hypothetical protein